MAGSIDRERKLAWPWHFSWFELFSCNHTCFWSWRTLVQFFTALANLAMLLSFTRSRISQVLFTNSIESLFTAILELNGGTVTNAIESSGATFRLLGATFRLFVFATDDSSKTLSTRISLTSVRHYRRPKLQRVFSTVQRERSIDPLLPVFTLRLQVDFTCS